ILCSSLRPPATAALLPYPTLFRSDPQEWFGPGGFARLRGCGVPRPGAWIELEGAGGLGRDVALGIDAVLDDLVARLIVFDGVVRSEEHTSELQSREKLVCRLLLEK